MADAKPKLVASNASVVERGVPMPPKRGGGKLGPVTLALRALVAAKIGDSVWVPKKTSSLGPYYISAAGCHGWYRSATEMRGGVDGSRVWKIAEPVRK